MRQGAHSVVGVQQAAAPVANAPLPLYRAPAAHARAASGMYIVTRRATDFEDNRGKFDLAAGIFLYYGCGLLLLGVVASYYLLVVYGHLKNVVVSPYVCAAAHAA